MCTYKIIKTMDLVLRCSICEKVDVEMEFAVPCSPTNEVFMLTLKDLSLSAVCFPANIYMVCVILGLCHSVNEIFTFLGCYRALIGI